MKRALSRIKGKSNRILEGVQTATDSSPFKIDFSSLKEFYIELEDPHRTWTPGDEVAGQIIFISNKNLANIVIKLSLLGFVKISGSSHSELRPFKHFLFNRTIKIYGEENESSPTNEMSSGLFKGEHRFPFIVKLPKKRIFTSIDFGKGSIKYLLKATIEDVFTSNSAPTLPGDTTNSTPSKFSILPKHKGFKVNNSSFTSEKVINLVYPIDVLKLPRAKAKRVIIYDPRQTKLSRTLSVTSTTNTFSSLLSNNSDNGLNNESARAMTMGALPGIHAPSSTNDIKVSLLSPERGYLRGEVIPLQLNVKHSRRIQDVNGIIITLVRVSRFDNGPESVFESFRKDLQQLVLPFYTDPVDNTCEIKTNLRVPADAFPTITGCPLVSFQYFIEVLINLSGKSITLDQNEYQNTNVVTDKSNHPLLDDGKENLEFRYNGYANPLDTTERSAFINTDKYKRLKKFLHLNSEIIIGTIRLDKVNSDGTSANSSRSSSEVSFSHDSSPGQIVISPRPQQQRSHIDTVPESELTENTIPPYDRDNSYPDIVPSSPAPRYDEHNEQGFTSISLPAPAHQPLSEKERMRIQENSLLPSEPPLDEFDITFERAPSPPQLNIQNTDVAEVSNTAEDLGSVSNPSLIEHPEYNFFGEITEGGSDTYERNNTDKVCDGLEENNTQTEHIVINT